MAALHFAQPSASPPCLSFPARLPPPHPCRGASVPSGLAHYCSPERWALPERGSHPAARACLLHLLRLRPCQDHPVRVRRGQERVLRFQLASVFLPVRMGAAWCHCGYNHRRICEAPDGVHGAQPQGQQRGFSFQMPASSRCPGGRCSSEGSWRAWSSAGPQLSADGVTMLSGV